MNGYSIVDTLFWISESRALYTAIHLVYPHRSASSPAPRGIENNLVLHTGFSKMKNVNCWHWIWAWWRDWHSEWTNSDNLLDALLS